MALCYGLTKNVFAVPRTELIIDCKRS